jgi:magnesium-transporting ATPase (P-type)
MPASRGTEPCVAPSPEISTGRRRQQCVGGRTPDLAPVDREVPGGKRPLSVRSGCTGREFGPTTCSVCFTGADVVCGTGTAVVIATGAGTHRGELVRAAGALRPGWEAIEGR